MSAANYLDRRISHCAAPLPHRVLYPDESRTVIIMVGLPARGKTYIAKKMARYLNWIGILTKVFNVGEYRRCQTTDYKNHDFFRSDNTDALELRNKAAADAVFDMTTWLKDEGEIALLDATNSTRERRIWLIEHCKDQNFQLVFVESICDDKKIIHENIVEVKINSPDYVGVDKEYAMKDFVERIKHYEETYDPLDEVREKDVPFIKIYNQGQKYLVNKLKGNIQSRIVYYLMNIKVGKRTIYIARHGESALNLIGKIGGDSDLSESGIKFSEILSGYIEKENIPNLKVWTSHMKRSVQTAERIPCALLEHWKALNEIDAGVCEEMSYDEIEKKYPLDFVSRDRDKYHYRYPMGESYQDLVARLEPVIMELEKRKNILVICHQAVARCFLAYFMDRTNEELPYIRVPLHTVFKLTPTAYGCDVEQVALDVSAVDTHREKPQNVECITAKVTRTQMTT